MSQEKVSKSKSNKTLLNDMKNGALSGLITIVFMQPFQVVNTSMVIHYQKENKLRMREVIKRIYLEEKIYGFYRGVLPSIIKSIVGSAIYFGSLESSKRFLRNSQIKYFKSSDSFNNFLSSGFARFIQISFVNPIIVIKTRFEVIGFNHYNGLLSGIGSIFQNEGLRGFYTGLNANLLKEVPNSAIFYTLYEFTKTKLKIMGIDNIQLQASIASLFTSNFLVLLFNPLDVIRMRQQYEFYNKNIDHKYNNVIHGLKQIWKTEGIRGMLLGVTPKFLKKGFQNIVIWTIYESLK